MFYVCVDAFVFPSAENFYKKPNFLSHFIIITNYLAHMGHNCKQTYGLWPLTNFHPHNCAQSTLSLALTYCTCLSGNGEIGLTKRNQCRHRENMQTCKKGNFS